MKLKCRKLFLWFAFYFIIILTFLKAQKNKNSEIKTRLSSQNKIKLKESNKINQDSKNLNSKIINKLSDLKANDKSPKKKDNNGKPLYSDSNSFSYLSAFDRKNIFLSDAIDVSDIYKNRYKSKRKK